MTGRESLREARDRLAKWAQDDRHLVQSVRMHEPVYANPGQLRADVRAILEDRCAACHGDPEAHGLHVCGKEPFA